MSWGENSVFVCAAAGILSGAIDNCLSHSVSAVEGSTLISSTSTNRLSPEDSSYLPGTAGVSPAPLKTRPWVQRAKSGGTTAGPSIILNNSLSTLMQSG